MEGCEFRTRRTRLKAHYINTHKMEDPEAEKLVPARLISTSDTQRMNCPLCEHRCLPIMLRKHLFRAHSKDLNLEEINMVFEEAIKFKAAPVAVGLPLPADGVLEDELESNPLFSKVQPDGRIACKAPECSKMVSAQNIARHWNHEHPSLKKDDFQPSMRKLIHMIKINHSESDTPVTSFQPSMRKLIHMIKINHSESDTPVTSAPNVVPKDIPSTLVKSNPPSKSHKKRISCRSSGCGYRTTSSLKMTEHRKDKGHLSPKKPKSQSPVIEHCGFEDCDFSTRYKSNLVRHRQRRNHFCPKKTE